MKAKALMKPWYAPLSTFYVAGHGGGEPDIGDKQAGSRRYHEDRTESLYYRAGHHHRHICRVQVSRSQ